MIGMKKLIALIALVISAKTAFGSSEQAEKLIFQHIDAIGGKIALENMKTISRHGSIVFYDQQNTQQYCYHTDIVYPNKLREQLKGDEILHERGTNGILFWLWNGTQYEYSDDQSIKETMLDTAKRANREMLWILNESDKYEIMPSPPSWAPNNSQCIEEINGNKHIYCFNSITGIENAIGSFIEHRLVDDWRRVGSIMIPFRLKHYLNDDLVYSIQLDGAILDREIPDSQFSKPDSASLSCEIAN